MYNLPYFKEKDIKIVLKFMQEHPFVLLTGCDSNNKPVATQVPLLLEEREGKLFFYGHVQRKTDHQLAFEKNPNVVLSDVKANLEMRDYIDSNREVSPLKMAEDAILLDNSNISMEQQLKFALQLVKKTVDD